MGPRPIHAAIDDFELALSKKEINDIDLPLHPAIPCVTVDTHEYELAVAAHSRLPAGDHDIAGATNVPASFSDGIMQQEMVANTYDEDTNSYAAEAGELIGSSALCISLSENSERRRVDPESSCRAKDQVALQLDSTCILPTKFTTSNDGEGDLTMLDGNSHGIMHVAVAPECHTHHGSLADAKGSGLMTGVGVPSTLSGQNLSKSSGAWSPKHRKITCAPAPGEHILLQQASSEDEDGSDIIRDMRDDRRRHKKGPRRSQRSPIQSRSGPLRWDTLYKAPCVLAALCGFTVGCVSTLAASRNQTPQRKTSPLDVRPLLPMPPKHPLFYPTMPPTMPPITPPITPSAPPPSPELPKKPVAPPAPFQPPPWTPDHALKVHRLNRIHQRFQTADFQSTDIRHYGVLIHQVDFEYDWTSGLPWMPKSSSRGTARGDHRFISASFIYQAMSEVHVKHEAAECIRHPPKCSPNSLPLLLSCLSQRHDRQTIPLFGPYAGFVLRAEQTQISCSFGVDGATWNRDCSTTRNRRCISGCGDPPDWCAHDGSRWMSGWDQNFHGRGRESACFSIAKQGQPHPWRPV